MIGILLLEQQVTRVRIQCIFTQRWKYDYIFIKFKKNPTSIQPAETFETTVLSSSFMNEDSIVELKKICQDSLHKSKTILIIDMRIYVEMRFMWSGRARCLTMCLSNPCAPRWLEGNACMIVSWTETECMSKHTIRGAMPMLNWYCRDSY